MPTPIAARHPAAPGPGDHPTRVGVGQAPGLEAVGHRANDSKHAELLTDTARLSRLLLGITVAVAGLLQRIPEFGRIDAESEAQLGAFFVRTDAYARIENQEHIIVVGRKGTGKTAIYKTLLERPENYSNFFATGLQFRDYPWGMHQEVQDSAAAPVERYSASWKFLILVELAKLILTSANHAPPRNEKAQKAADVLADFIRTNWGELDFKFRDIFNRRKYSFKFEPTVLGNKLGSLDMNEVPRDRLASVLTEANRWLEYCLELLLTDDQWYVVLFDDLDRGYDPSDDEYVARLIGLLLAAREVYQWAGDRKLDVAPTVFIRSDIYDSLSFPDKNKLTQNLVETLMWTDEESGENSLKTLIDQRIRTITAIEAGDPWALVFDDQLMRGTQTKFKHMATRTYLRPRDMIQFSNLCLQRAKAVGADLISNQSIAAARPQYSEYLISELDDEIHEVEPEWRRCLDALRRIHTLRFRRDAFESAYNDLNLERHFRSVDDVLELMFRFSIIGFTKIGGSGYGGSAVAWRYQDQNVNFDPAAPYFTAHPGLKEALELVESGEERTNGS
jgi:hypothetical protein